MKINKSKNKVEFRATQTPTKAKVGSNAMEEASSLTGHTRREPYLHIRQKELSQVQIQYVQIR
jgi:hypothetical protein